MQTFVDWIRSVLILYFLMMIVLYFSAGESFKKFIRFFMGLVFALTVMAPLIRLFGQADALKEGISYENFRQDMEEAQLDFSHMEQTQEQVYRVHYGRAMEEQFAELAREHLLQIKKITVTLDDNYEPQQVRIQEGLTGDGEVLRDYLCEVYGLQKGQVVVE